MYTPLSAPDEALLTMKEVLAMLRVSRTTMYALIRSGRIPTVHIGRALRFRQQDVQRYVASQLRPAPAPIRNIPVPRKNPSKIPARPAHAVRVRPRKADDGAT